MKTKTATKGAIKIIDEIGISHLSGMSNAIPHDVLL